MKLKKGAKKWLRRIRTASAIVQVSCVLGILLIGMQTDPRLWTLIPAFFLGVLMHIAVECYCCANELLTGYIYGGEEHGKAL